jgi:OmpA-OmpF porin, OOP family
VRALLRRTVAALTVGWLGCTPVIAAAETCVAYYDSVGRRIWLHPQSFVDRAVCPDKANSSCGNELAKATIRGRPLLNVPESAVGPPTYRPNQGSKRTIYSLGCKKSATWQFIDNVIVDTPGQDIFVFEVGPRKEPTAIELSEDGATWTAAGEIGGSSTTTDIHTFVQRGQKFRFIRLTDIGEACNNGTPGADIDAVAAIAYSWTDTTSDAQTVLFDSGSAMLKPDAGQFLDRIVTKIQRPEAYRIQIEGHTDSIGLPLSNRALSQRRADSVAAYLIEHHKIPSRSIATFGFGEAVPVEPDDTKSNVGNPANRRVELTMVPLEACAQPASP